MGGLKATSCRKMRGMATFISYPKLSRCIFLGVKVDEYGFIHFRSFETVSLQ
jgi:hypothetical protein